MSLQPFTFHAPSSLKEALKLQTELDDAQILAGGTFLLNRLKLFKKKGIKTPQNIIGLRKVNELKGIHLDGDTLIIRAMTTIRELFDSPLLTGNFSVLKTVCRNIATTPIRNMATVGGNLTCRYTWTEMGIVMMALDAKMHFIGPGGKEEVITTEDFFKKEAKTDKIFSHISIKKDTSCSASYCRVKKTLHVDIPLLAVCIKTGFSKNHLCHARVAVNNGIAFAQRDHVLEDFLNNASCNKQTAEEACDHLDTPLYDTRSDDYKKYIFRVSIKNALRELLENRKK